MHTKVHTKKKQIKHIDTEEAKLFHMCTNQYLNLDPVLDHLHDCLHHLGVLRLVDESDEDGGNERLAYVGGHGADAVLDQVQAENEQLAGDVAEVRSGRREVLACHALKHAHERRQQPVDVERIVHAGRLQDHQCAEQL